MTIHSATISRRADQSMHVARNWDDMDGLPANGTGTLTVRSVAEPLPEPSSLRYPHILALPELYTAVRDQMLAAASPLFEFWLNDVDAVYDES